MIRVTGLVKRFGDVTALNGVDFTASDGRITGLLGPNGAGKTTALRILSTILRADAGTATVDGWDCATQALRVQSRIGVLPERHGLYPRLSSRENVHYYGRLHGMDEGALARATERLAEVLDMGDILDRRTEGFSHGQRVKVALARVLVHQPHNVLLDEPTVGLDVMSTRAMRAFVRSLRDEGRCILFSSHIMQEVLALCDEIVILAHGRVVACGSPDEIKSAAGCESLEDAFVAAIGSKEGLE